MICTNNQTCFNGLTSIIMAKLYLNKHMQHLGFEVMFRMFYFHVTPISDVIMNARWCSCTWFELPNACLTPRVLHPPTPWYPLERLMNRRQPGKGRTELDTLVVIMPNTARKSGNGTRQPAETLSGNAWPQKSSTTNANNKKKYNGNVGSMTPSGHLLHATSTPSSWWKHLGP
jgi:hypothetical protein